MKKIVITAVIGVFILGCSSKEVALKIYTLNVTHTSKVSFSRYKTKTIKVSFPQTLKDKITTKMYYSYSLNEQGTYLNSQWSNNIGKLLEGMFINTLTQSQLFHGVLPYASTATEDYRLESTILDFSHHVRGTDSYAIVSIEFSLIDTDTGRLIKSKRFSYKEFTTTTDAKGYVEASTKALTRLNKALVTWIRK